MNSAYLPALAALAGSAVGGLTSFASAWLTQHRHDRAERLSQDKSRRQKLYKQFIDEASELYADALVHDQAEVSALVSVYALISRMRVLSSSAVIERAEAVVRMIVDTYFAPNKTFPELPKLMDGHSIDPLRAFSEECRAELSNAPPRPFLGSTR
jgi:glycogen debranching enzyme